MKRRNSGRNARFADMAVCRKVEKTDSAAEEISSIPVDLKTNQPGFMNNKLIRTLPSIAVIMVVATLVLHMTIGGGAALVPANDEITCYDDGFAVDELASAEALAIGDFALNRSLQTIDNSAEANVVDSAEIEDPLETQPNNTSINEVPDETEAAESEITEPEATEPEATEPEVTEPEVTEPEITGPVFEETDVTMFLQANAVNLRSGPSTDTEILTVLNYGQTLRRTGVSAEWSKVELENGIEGYLMNKFIDGAAPPTPTPSPTPAPEPEPTAAPTAAPTKAPPEVEKASSMSAETQQQMIKLARSFIGYPYVYATSGPSSFDCSGFTSYIYREMFGISLPRSARDQAFAGTRVSASSIQVGDIICFDWKRDGVCDHVALYIGNGQYVDASYSRGLVREGTVNFSTNPIISIRRIVN